jgi:hypothetical protein
MEAPSLPDVGLTESQSAFEDALQEMFEVRVMVLLPPLAGKESAMKSTENLGMKGSSEEQKLNKKLLSMIIIFL